MEVNIWLLNVIAHCIWISDTGIRHLHRRAFVQNFLNPIHSKMVWMFHAANKRAIKESFPTTSLDFEGGLRELSAECKDGIFGECTAFNLKTRCLPWLFAMADTASNNGNIIPLLSLAFPLWPNGSNYPPYEHMPSSRSIQNARNWLLVFLVFVVSSFWRLAFGVDWLGFLFPENPKRTIQRRKLKKKKKKENPQQQQQQQHEKRKITEKYI